MQRKNRIDENKLMNCGLYAKIIKYNNNYDVRIRFNDGYETTCTYQNFTKGNIKSPYVPTIYGVGYIGEGKYTSGTTKKHDIKYQYWRDMIKRCYDEKTLIKFPTYKDCTVCDEWHNYQNFAEWYDENYYEVDGQKMALDKDILYKGNKLYSPKNCIFVPERINGLFIKRQNDRGNYPIGVSSHQCKFEAHCSLGNGKIKYLNRFDTIEEAFNVYKNFKENYIKQLADYYKDRIPKKLYDALYNWKVEITD